MESQNLLQNIVQENIFHRSNKNVFSRIFEESFYIEFIWLLLCHEHREATDAGRGEKRGGTIFKRSSRLQQNYFAQSECDNGAWLRGEFVISFETW